MLCWFKLMGEELDIEYFGSDLENVLDELIVEEKKDEDELDKIIESENLDLYSGHVGDEEKSFNLGLLNVLDFGSVSDIENYTEDEETIPFPEIRSEVNRSIISLNILYDNLPKTSGCEKCSEVNGEENKDWCCKRMSPSMYYVEFLNVFYEFQKWSHKRKKEVILKAIANYLSNNLEKGCIFYNNGCSVYKQRPLACFQYGVIPETSWNKRWEALKKRDGDKFCGIPQCNLVKSETLITPELENKWFEYTKKCEERIGITKEMKRLLKDIQGLLIILLLLN